MRNANIVILVGLLTAAGLWAKETFKAQMSMAMSSFEVNFTVSEAGYSWAGTDGHYRNGPIPWKDVRRWSCQGENSGFALTLHHQTGVDDFRFRHDDLVTIVNNYLMKYAGDKLDAKEGCHPD